MKIIFDKKNNWIRKIKVSDLNTYLDVKFERSAEKIFSKPKREVKCIIFCRTNARSNNRHT